MKDKEGNRMRKLPTTHFSLHYRVAQGSASGSLEVVTHMLK